MSNGWVFLEGEVDFLYERWDAESAVSHLTGVRGVTNHIQVESAVTADEIRDQIEEALERRALREVKHIKVAVGPDGVVSLEGPVRTWADREAIIGSVRYLPGVRDVQVHLPIVPSS